MDHYSMEDLLRIMELLRAPEGCPWDREQTHQSIRRNMLEEAYEVAEAIDNRDTANLKEELGDVLLQVVFHSRMARRRGCLPLTMWWTASARSWYSATPMSLAQWTPGTPARR